MFKDLTKEVPPIMNVLNIHENLLEALLEMGNYADVQGTIRVGPWSSVARWRNLIPSFSWIAPGWRAWGRNPKKGRYQILQRSVAEP